MFRQEFGSHRGRGEGAATGSRVPVWSRQCPPDEAGTASALQGLVCRAVVKDVSDADRAVNKLKQTDVWRS